MFTAILRASSRERLGGRSTEATHRVASLLGALAAGTSRSDPPPELGAREHCSDGDKAGRAKKHDRETTEAREFTVRAYVSDFNI